MFRNVVVVLGIALLAPLAVEAKEWAVLPLEEEHFLLPSQQVTPESAAPH